MTDIESLKKVKVPIWAKFIGYYRARQRRKAASKEIHYIATVYAWTHWTDSNNYETSWFICKQTGAGKRFYEHGSGSALLRNREKHNTVYAHIIVPWLHGAWSNQQLIDYARKSAAHPKQSA